MIGIVVVSHSLRLARAAVDLALEMVHGEKPAIAIAAGTVEGLTGTDAVRVSEAITAVSSPEGVLVMMDLGSAVLSAEMSLEFIADSTTPVRLTSAPFVEGLLAAVVMAAGGASLDAIEAEARGALAAKRSQLGDEPERAPAPVQHGELRREVEVVNPDGMHARPAARLVAALATFDATVTAANLRTNAPPVTISGPTSLLVLGARRADRLAFSASGPDAQAALDTVAAMFAEGFGEMEATAHVARPRASAGPMGVSPGRVVGPVVQMPPPVEEPAPGHVADDERPAEAARVASAVAVVAASLRDRAALVSGEAKEILEANAVMAADPSLLSDAQGLVSVGGQTAERAVWLAVTAFAELLAAQGGRMAERVADLHDLRNRLVAALLGRPAPGVPQRAEPFVLVARDLAPADTALLDPSTCLALVTEQGGPTSHTAILARSLGIPAIVAANGATAIAEGTLVLVDGGTGTFEVDPSAETVAAVSAQPAVAAFAGFGHTKDGHGVQLLANVGSPESVGEAVTAGAEGIGLFRTEFCFLDRETAPSVDEQVVAYQKVFAAFPGRKVIVRTLDAGADKPLAFVTDVSEENPALGIRGIRTSWRHAALLDDQLRAIAVAAERESANVAVMAPMIATVDEAVEFATSCAAHGLSLSGAMVETPAAALLAREILEHVEFLSLGTNDLTQYTLAADRQSGELASLNDPWQPSVLRLIKLTAEAGASSSKPVGVCGEAAADPLLAAVLVGLGVTSLSMSARAIAPVAAQLAAVTIGQCRRAADAAHDAPTAAAAREAAVSLLR